MVGCVMRVLDELGNDITGSPMQAVNVLLAEQKTTGLIFLVIASLCLVVAVSVVIAYRYRNRNNILLDNNSELSNIKVLISRTTSFGLNSFIAIILLFVFTSSLGAGAFKTNYPELVVVKKSVESATIDVDSRVGIDNRLITRVLNDIYSNRSTSVQNAWGLLVQYKYLHGAKRILQAVICISLAVACFFCIRHIAKKEKVIDVFMMEMSTGEKCELYGGYFDGCSPNNLNAQFFTGHYFVMFTIMGIILSIISVYFLYGGIKIHLNPEYHAIKSLLSCLIYRGSSF